MYETADAIGRGDFFWSTFSETWPSPFRFSGIDYAVLSFADSDMSVIVCTREIVDGPDRIVLQVCQHRDESILLDVMLTVDMHYVNGKSMNFPLDELAAVNALKLFVPVLGGTWTFARQHSEGDEYV